MKVGQKVYLKYRGRDHSVEDRIIETEIVKVGRKYIYVDYGNPSWRFRIDTLFKVTPFFPEWRLYFNKQDILYEFEAEEIVRKIKELIEGNKLKLSIGKLRQIKKIIDESLGEVKNERS